MVLKPSNHLGPVDAHQADESGEHQHLQGHAERGGETVAQQVSEVAICEARRGDIDRVGDEPTGEEGGGQRDQRYVEKSGGDEELSRRDRL